MASREIPGRHDIVLLRTQQELSDITSREESVIFNRGHAGRLLVTASDDSPRVFGFLSTIQLNLLLSHLSSFILVRQPLWVR
ncbi:MAG TPA: hypothetical protein VKE49_03180, partial [Myxococcaceae bacterium]|nr:hypothetical protein [Myxococcaceae bacterium]